jgi:hypothetical protein
MAGLRVFVSSTCYDLSAVRGQLRIFIQSLGHEPVMSDFSDVLYDPRIHTHTSCVDEVAGCDIILLMVGSRFGGKSVPEAVAKIDFEALQKESKSLETLKNRENVSVTQLEILKAVEQGLPVFTFIDERVWHDHALYEKNKNKKILPEITFPSIERHETAAFIFEFINFLRHRTRGNSVFPFSKIQDIEEAMRRQWSSLFQRLLNEQRARAAEAKRIDLLTEQFEDLKTAILTSIGTSNERTIARGVVRFRRLSEFLQGVGLQDHNIVLRETRSWKDLLAAAGITEIIDANELPISERDRVRRFGVRPRTYLLKSDGTFYEMRYPPEAVHQLELDWDAFIQLPGESRAVILDALSEMSSTAFRIVRHVPTPFDRHLKELLLGDLIEEAPTEKTD